MPKLVKVGLLIAGVLFIFGITWAIIATRNNNKKEAENTQTTTQTTITTSTPIDTNSTPAEVTTTTPSTPITTTKKSLTKKTVPVTTYTYTTESFDSVASAWASAGTNADGSTYAEAHAE